MTGFRYKDSDTAIHRLNPFCKLLWLVNILVFALIFDNPVYLVALFLATLPLVAAAGIVKEWLSVMKFTLYLGIAIVLINMLVSYHGAHILFEAPFRLPVVGVPTLTLEAAFFGVAMSLRLLAIISAFAVLTLTVHPDDLLVAMIKMKLPYKSVLVTSLSTRFIPALVEDAQCLSDVQRSRGLELDRGSLVQKIRSRMAIVIPLLSNSLDRTVQLSEAMESRAFGSGGKRTFYKPIRFAGRDALALTLGFLAAALGIFMRLWGYGDYQYYPALGGIGAGALEWSMLGLLVLLLLSGVFLAAGRREAGLD